MEKAPMIYLRDGLDSLIDSIIYLLWVNGVDMPRLSCLVPCYLLSAPIVHTYKDYSFLPTL